MCGKAAKYDRLIITGFVFLLIAVLLLSVFMIFLHNRSVGDKQSSDVTVELIDFIYMPYGLHSYIIRCKHDDRIYESYDEAFYKEYYQSDINTAEAVHLWYFTQNGNEVHQIYVGNTKFDYLCSSEDYEQKGGTYLCSQVSDSE